MVCQGTSGAHCTSDTMAPDIQTNIQPQHGPGRTDKRGSRRGSPGADPRGMRRPRNAYQPSMARAPRPQGQWGTQPHPVGAVGARRRLSGAVRATVGGVPWRLGSANVPHRWRPTHPASNSGTSNALVQRPSRHSHTARGQSLLPSLCPTSCHRYWTNWHRPGMLRHTTSRQFGCTQQTDRPGSGVTP